MWLWFVLPPSVMVLWMIGGQFSKGARRYGVPGMALITSLIKKWKREPKERAKVSVFLLLVPILCMGYGINSWLMKIFKKDLYVRFAYAIILSIPYGIYIGITPQHNLMTYILITILLITAFQVRAGSLGKIGTYDILVEDMARSLTVGFSLAWLLY